MPASRSRQVHASLTSPFGQNQAIDTPAGSLLAELTWVHQHLRHDLEVCQTLATQIESGAATEAVRAGVARLQINGPLFQLKVNCLRYCGLVHGHHGLEDAMVFPAIRRRAPELVSEVDRLESDHRTVSDLLDTVEARTYELDDEAGSAGRQALSTALRVLADVLLKHLEREETVLAPVLGRSFSWSDLIA